MPEVIIRFKRIKTIELTFNRELTEEEIDKIESETFDPDDYQYTHQGHPDVSHEETYGYYTEFDEMEFGDCDNDTYDCIFSNSNIDSYRDYLKNKEDQEDQEDQDYIKPHGKPLFN